MGRPLKSNTPILYKWSQSDAGVRRPDYAGVGRPQTFPDLNRFSEKYSKNKLKNNWHHTLFYDILMNRVIMDEDGKLVENIEKRKRGNSVSEEYIRDKFNQNILLLAPRFHSKSHCFTITYPLWELYRNPNQRIIIVSANGDIATGFVRAIMNQLENNEKLIEDWGDLVPSTKRKWGEKALLVERDSDEKDPSIVGIGVGGKLISRRADIIIVDDLIDIDTARTKHSRAKTLEWFENVLLPILEDDGRLIVVGTSWYRGDIYDHLMENSKFDIKTKLKALMYHEKHLRSHTTKGDFSMLPYRLSEYSQALKAQDLLDEKLIKRYQLYTKLKGGVIWEDKWSFPKLLKKKENMTHASFLRQYMNEPVSEEDQVFKAGFIKGAVLKGMGKRLLDEWENGTDTKEGHMIVTIGVDLAISKKKTSDFSAIAVWGLTEQKKRRLINITKGRWSPDEVKQRVIDAYHQYNPVKIKVENVAFQDMLRQDLVNDDIPVEGFSTQSSNKFNPVTGLAHAAMLFEQGKIIIPSSAADSEKLLRVKDLLSEFENYQFDIHAGDMLMASWFALDALREFDKNMATNHGFFKTSALVEQHKKARAPHKVSLLGTDSKMFRFMYNSLIYIFRSVTAGEAFIDPKEKFMILASAYERSCAYILEKATSEIVGKIEGNISPSMYASLLEKSGFFFNNAQIVVDRNGHGNPVYLELERKNYPHLLCSQPDKDGSFTVKPGFKIDDSSLPLSVDHFKSLVDMGNVTIPDQKLTREMAELIGIEGTNMNMSFGTGLRIKVASTALWLLDNYENEEKLYNEGGRTKKLPKKELKTRYLTFK